MTGQAKNTAYELSKAEEPQQINKSQSASVLSPIWAFFTRHRSLALSLSSVLSVLVIWYLITALKVVPSLFLPSPQAVWQKFLEVS